MVGSLSIFIGSLLLIASIVGSRLSARTGAPLLLIFLAVGMLAGENGPGGIHFNDASLAFVVGSCALAVILFDGGLRIEPATIRLAWAPALALATVGVLITAGLVAAFAHWCLGLGWLLGLLLGSIVASTDAAAVFMLLGPQGIALRDRLRATLELESGSNDPMGIFLTMTFVHAIGAPEGLTVFYVVSDFVAKAAIGVVVGIACGRCLSWLINQLELAAGLYPILALALCLFSFSGAELIGGSGFLSVYLAGIAFGGRRVRAKALIGRFFDGLTWLAQIVLFLLLGLLVTPNRLLAELDLAVAISLVLIFVARPIAVAAALAPFGFSWREQAFAAWVGLRGAVPIFLALFPLMAGIDASGTMFNVAFVVVLVSVVLQGWTIPWSARRLGIALTPMPEAARKIEYDTLNRIDRDLVAYTIKPHSRATDFPFADLALPARVRIVTVIRDGVELPLDRIDRLKADDFVLVLTPPEASLVVDRFFSRRFKSTTAQLRPELADFIVDGASPMDELIRAYGLPVAPVGGGRTVAQVMRERIGPAVGRGDRARFGAIDLVVIDLLGRDIKEVGLVIRNENRFSQGLRRLLARLRPPWWRRHD